MNHYKEEDLQRLYGQVPQELYDRVGRTLSHLPENNQRKTRMTKKFSISLIAAAATLICLITAAFATGTIQRWLYTYQYTLLEDGTVEIQKYNGNDESVTIPDEIDGYRVTRIGNKAFYQCFAVREIVIPKGVTEIGSQAFSNCTSLRSITIPDSVTMIFSYAFDYCSALTEIHLPESVEFLGYGVFGRCFSLRSIQLPSKITVLYRDLFYSCRSLENAVIPASVTRIGENAFSYCESLTEIILPEGLTTIEQYAFGECTGLREITIPAGVKEISKYAFLGCKNLRLIVEKDSYATEYCEENGFNYKELPQIMTVQ